MKRFTILIFLIFLLASLQLNAQTFRAYLVGGFNLTDDNLTESGNSQVGSRPGLNLGPGVAFMLNKRLESSMELLFSQNGYFLNPVQIPSVPLDKITLNYLEVPLTFSYCFNIKKTEEERFYARRLSAGIAYARLFSHKIRAIDETNVTDDFRFDKENAFLFHFGATSYFNESFAINGKWTISTFGEFTLALRVLYFI